MRRPEELRVEDAARAAAARRSASAPPQGHEALEAAGAAAEVDGIERGGSWTQEAFPAFWSSCSTIGPERERREERQRADDDDDADEQDRPQDARSSGTCPSDGATLRLAAIEPAMARIGMIIP